MSQRSTYRNLIIMLAKHVRSILIRDKWRYIRLYYNNHTSIKGGYKFSSIVVILQLSSGPTLGGQPLGDEEASL